MQGKTILRTSSLNSLNKRNSIKLNSKEKGDAERRRSVERSVFPVHPASAFIRGSTVSIAELKKYATVLYKGLFYSVNNLKGPSEEFIKKKKVQLAQPADSKKKFLMLDLDETLIHSVFTGEKTDVRFVHKGDEFKFNVRPYCQQFLEAMSEHYNIYVFTAGTQEYAEPIVAYLNQKKKTILGLMHRRNCMETQNGFFIKDLRIIQNRCLEEIIIVDNLVHSFGLQLSNGIPIIEFINNKNDREFIGLQKLLLEISRVSDVRQAIKEKVKLLSCLDHTEAEFLSVDQLTKQ